jgi:hypothetical protein
MNELPLQIRIPFDKGFTPLVKYIKSTNINPEHLAFSFAISQIVIKAFFENDILDIVGYLKEEAPDIVVPPLEFGYGFDLSGNVIAAQNKITCNFKKEYFDKFKENMSNWSFCLKIEYIDDEMIKMEIVDFVHRCTGIENIIQNGIAVENFKIEALPEWKIVKFI